MQERVHEAGDESCPDLWYWWDETWARYGVRKDPERAGTAAAESAAALTAKGYERVQVIPINIETRDGFFAVRYSTHLRYAAKFHVCQCAEPSKSKN